MPKVMHRLVCFAVATALSTTGVSANDWQKFYTPMPGGDQYQKTDQEPEVIASTGNFERDIELMWRRGFGPIGYTSFTTNNGKTKDGLRFAKKLGASHVVIATQVVSSHQTAVPLTLPTTNVATTTGNATVTGYGGTAFGSYSGTTTTTGSSTTYIPVTVNRFEKGAIYFGKAPEGGTGIYARELTKEEVSLVESQRAFAIAFIRDNSPAYHANLLPGDIVAEVNGQPADEVNWKAARAQNASLKLKIYRNSQAKELTLNMPPSP